MRMNWGSRLGFSSRFHNGMARNAQLMRRGGIRFLPMGGLGDDTSAPSWSAGLLDFAKSVTGLVNQQRSFNQQMSVAKAQGVPVQAASPVYIQAQKPAMNMRNVALLGGAGILGAVLLVKVMSRR